MAGALTRRSLCSVEPATWAAPAQESAISAPTAKAAAASHSMVGNTRHQFMPDAPRWAASYGVDRPAPYDDRHRG